jgi:competence protein ComEC
MARGALFLPAALAGVCLGILGQDGGAIAPGLVAPLAVGGVLLATGAAAARRTALFVAGVLVLGAAVGAWRGADAALPDGPGSLAALADGGVDAEWRISGTVQDEPRPRGERQQVVLAEVSVAGPDGREASAPGRLLVWVPRAVLVGSGDRLAFDGDLEPPRDFDGFAYREYLARQGIGATAAAFRVEVTAEGAPGPLAELRGTLLRGLNGLIPEPEGALAAGILLGVRTGIAPEVSDAFATAGLTHVVAISGWNIAIVAAVAGALTRPLLRLPGGRVGALGVAATAVGGYVLLTGASPSVVRAALMSAGLLAARLDGSRAHAIAALMLAALAMLVAAPPVLWDVGFQLSALATAGLIWFGAGMEARLARWPALVREPVALTLAAQLTTLPVVLLNFERLSLVSPAANVLVVPLVPLVMLCAAIAAVVGTAVDPAAVPILGDALAWAAGGAAWLYLRLMILAGQLAAAVPLASVELTAPSWLAAAWYPLLIVVHRRMPPAERVAAELPVGGAGRALRPVPVASATLLALALLTLATQPDGRLHLVMLDVGQGDAILVRAPSGATMLIDGGPDPDVAARRVGEALPFWQRRIDVVVLTHPHEDHVAGLVPVLERYRVGLVLEPGRVYDNPTYPRFRGLAAMEPGARLAVARAGQRYALDATTSLAVLFPADADAAASLPEGDINNASIVALLEHGGFRALLTGDAEGPVETLLLERGALGPVDVLKVGHHGSDSSTSPALLAALRPRLALISAGAGNEYGHPHRVTLEKLATIPGLTILRTDRDGTVELVVEGAVIGVERRGLGDTGSIGPWPSPPSIARRSSWPGTRCRRGSCGTRAAYSASRPRRRASSRRRGSRWTRPSSRSPPCCTTWTSPKPADRSATALRRPRGWWSSAGRSWRSRSPRTRSPPCWTRSATREAGRR